MYSLAVLEKTEIDLNGINRWIMGLVVKLILKKV